jgi:hypothetical protein
MTLNPLLLTLPALLATQSWLTGPGAHHPRARPRYSRYHDPQVIQRLLDRFNLPSNITDLTIRLEAGALATMTVTRFVPPDELEALSEWYVTENLETFPTGTTTYTLTPRRTD